MKTLYLLKSSISTSSFLTLVFASLFLVSLGMLHNAFADTMVGTIPAGGHDAATNPSTNRIYIANSSQLVVVNGSDNKILDTIQTPSYHVAVNPVTNKIYTTDFNVNNPCSVCFSVIDGNTDKVVTTMNIGQYPFDVTVNVNTNEVYVGDQQGAIYVINGTTNNLVTTIPINGSIMGVEANPVTNKIYVQCNCPANTLVVIDGSENKVIANVSLSTNLPGEDVAVNSDTNTVYVTGRYSVSVVNGTTNAVSAEIDPCNTIFDINLNPHTNKIYVSCINFGIVAVIDGATNTLVQQIPVGSGPQGIGVNPNTDMIYVPNSNNEAFVIDGSSSGTSVPSAPVNLTATVSSKSQINLNWTAPSSDGGSAITGYQIERSTDGGTTWSTIVSNTGSTTTTYSDTGLTPSIAYTYRVSAINSVGTSSPSNTASATTSANATNGIVLNNIKSTSGTASSSNPIVISNFDAGIGSNQLLLVGVSANNNDVASVTFGGIHLKNGAYSFYNNDAEFWYLKNPSGTGNIIVTMHGTTRAVVGAYSFSGVNQTLPIATHTVKHNTNPNSPKISITTKYANDWVLDLSSIYGGSTLGSPTCTQQWDTNVPNKITGASSSVLVPTPGAITCSWTASSGDLWDDVAVELNAAR